MHKANRWTNKELARLEEAVEIKIRDKIYTQTILSLVEGLDKDTERMLQIAREQAEEKFKELSNKETLSPVEEKEMSEVFVDLL